MLPFEERVNTLAAHPEYLVPMLFHHVRNSLYLDDVPRLTKELAVFRKALGRPLSTFRDGDGNDILWHVFYNQSVLLFPKSDLELVAHKPEFLSCFAAEGCDTERRCKWGFTWDDVWKSIAYRDATLL